VKIVKLVKKKNMKEKREMGDWRDVWMYGEIQIDLLNPKKSDLLREREG
jgi:hypothetical protein